MGTPRDPFKLGPQPFELEIPQSALDVQVDGDHYINSIQPVQYISANELNFFQGNIVKYATRAPFKNQFRKDILKIKHYCDLWLELEGEKYE